MVATVGRHDDDVIWLQFANDVMDAADGVASEASVGLATLGAVNRPSWYRGNFADNREGEGQKCCVAMRSYRGVTAAREQPLQAFGGPLQPREEPSLMQADRDGSVPFLACPGST